MINHNSNDDLHSFSWKEVHTIHYEESVIDSFEEFEAFIDS